MYIYVKLRNVHLCETHVIMPLIPGMYIYVKPMCKVQEIHHKEVLYTIVKSYKN